MTVGFTDTICYKSTTGFSYIINVHLLNMCSQV